VSSFVSVGVFHRSSYHRLVAEPFINTILLSTAHVGGGGVKIPIYKTKVLLVKAVSIVKYLGTSIIHDI